MLFRFGLIFFLFTVVMLILSGITMYVSENKSYRDECQERIRKVAKYLDSLITADGDTFIAFQDYYMDNYHDMEIPIDFDEYLTKEREFRALMEERHPGEAFGKDIRFEDLEDDLKKAYAEYYHEFWLLYFEKAKEEFDLAYCYYLDLEENNDGSYEVYYVFDGERTEREGSGGKLLHLGDTYHHTPAEQPVEWKVWSTGRETEEFQEWDNAWGHTYTHYVPLIINGRKLGLVCTEINVVDVNKGILVNTLRMMAGIGFFLILCVGLVLFIINRAYISKIVRLSNNVQRYSNDKDAAIADAIERECDGRDELSVLSGNMAEMVRELDDHMKNLIATNRELTETRQRASSMQALANKDALTGIRNKTAYDQEIALIDNALREEGLEFGIAMIDLNFLKKINDTYGHEQGNIAIKKLCHIVCVIFDHSPVFRVGGDEFVVILKGHDLESYEELWRRFEEEMKILKADDSLDEWEKVSAAIGAAFFDPGLDRNASDVFKRADNKMYERKKEMKAVRSE